MHPKLSTYILSLTIFLCASCNLPKQKKWSEKRYKLMMWEFAASLEKNYNRLDTLPETDEQGKRRIKSIYPQAKKTKNRKKRAYLEKIKKDRIYDPKAHKDQN